MRRGLVPLKGAVERSLLMLHSCSAIPFSAIANRSSASSSPGRFRLAPATTFASMATTAQEHKKALRSEIRKALKALSPEERAKEDFAIQNTILSSSWFKSSQRMCAYISCPALREVDTSTILSQVLTKPDSVMSATKPVDLFLLPGLAFDKQGSRLGRGGGYYDVLLKKYQDLALEKKWNKPLLVALAYSVQIKEEGVIPVTPTDIPIDAIVSSNGTIPITPLAKEKMS